MAPRSWKWVQHHGGSCARIPPHLTKPRLDLARVEDLRAGFDAFTLQELAAHEDPAALPKEALVSEAEAAALVAELRRYREHHEELRQDNHDYRYWDGSLGRLREPWRERWRPLEEALASHACDEVALVERDLAALLVREPHPREVDAEGDAKRRKTRGPALDTGELMAVLEYRPRWEAFRVFGVYDSCYRLLWRDLTQTWEPGALLDEQREQCARAMRAWLRDRAVVIKTRMSDPGKAFSLDAEPVPEEASELLRASLEKVSASTASFVEKRSFLPEERHHESYAAVWGAIADAQAALVIWEDEYACKDVPRKLHCMRSPQDETHFYLWEEATGRGRGLPTRRSENGCHLSRHGLVRS